MDIEDQFKMWSEYFTKKENEMSKKDKVHRQINNNRIVSWIKKEYKWLISIIRSVLL